MTVHGHQSGTGRLEKALGAQKTGPLQAPEGKKLDHEPKHENKGSNPFAKDLANLGGPKKKSPSSLLFSIPKGGSGKKDGGSLDVDLSQVFNSQKSDS